MTEYISHCGIEKDSICWLELVNNDYTKYILIMVIIVLIGILLIYRADIGKLIMRMTR